MATPSADQKIEWDGDSLAELMSALQAAALPVRIEVIAPGAMGGNAGEVQLLAGGVADAFAGSLRRDDAVAALQRIEGARFLVETRLPDPESGSLGEPGPRAGQLKDRPLASLMRYCEDYVLTCELQIARGQERAMIGYRRGEIASTTVNGSEGEERFPEVLAWTDGSYEIVLPPPALPPSHRREARPSDGAAKPEYRRRATLPMAPAPPAAPAPTVAQARPTELSSTNSFEPAKSPPPPPATRAPAMPAPQRPAAPPSTRPSMPPPSSLRLPPPPMAPAAKASDARAAASAHPAEVPSSAFPPETTRRGIPAVPPAAGAPTTTPKKDVPAAVEAKPAAPRPAGAARPQTLARHASPPTAGAAAAKPASPAAAPAKPAFPAVAPAKPASPAVAPAKPASPAVAPAKPTSPAAAPSRQAPAGAAAPAGKPTPAPATAVPRRPTPLSTQAPAPAPRQPTPPPASAHVSVKQPTPPPATAAAARARPIENPPIPPARPIKPSPASPTSNDLKPASGTIQAKPRRSAPARPVAAPIEVLQERAAPPPSAHATPAVVAGHAARHRQPRSSARKPSNERPVRVYVFMGLAIGVGIVLAYWLYWALPLGH